jgi:hypothetical protein
MFNAFGLQSAGGCAHAAPTVDIANRSAQHFIDPLSQVRVLLASGFRNVSSWMI